VKKNWALVLHSWNTREIEGPRGIKKSIASLCRQWGKYTRGHSKKICPRENKRFLETRPGSPRSQHRQKLGCLPGGRGQLQNESGEKPYWGHLYLLGRSKGKSGEYATEKNGGNENALRGGLEGILSSTFA